MKFTDMSMLDFHKVTSPLDAISDNNKLVNNNLKQQRI
jgi:hypothetical protein